MNYKRLLCLLLSMLFAFSAIFQVAAETEEELQQNIDDIQQQIDENQQALDNLNESAAAQRAELEALEAQLDKIETKATQLQAEVHAVNEQIISLTTLYNQLTDEIAEKTRSIARTKQTIKETEKSIEENKTLLAAKLRSAYINGNDPTLEILMGADSLASFLTRLEFMKRSSENDKKTISDFEKKVTTLNKSKIKLEKDKDTIEKNKAKVEETKKEYVVKKNELEVKQKEYDKQLAAVEKQYAKVEAYIAKLDKQGATYQGYIIELEQQKAEADAALDEFIRNYLANNPPLSSDNNQDGQSQGSVYYESNDDWVWPVGGYGYYISAYYLDPTYYAEFGTPHYGVDITGGGFYGTSIYAARAGTVIASGDGGDGYGCKVIIDHGDGFITVYAHNSYNVVSAGQYVSKGELISYGGNSGYSSGPHLHYEVRYNGEKVDPAYYHPGKI